MAAIAGNHRRVPVMRGSFRSAPCSHVGCDGRTDGGFGKRRRESSRRPREVLSLQCGIADSVVASSPCAPLPTWSRSGGGATSATGPRAGVRKPTCEDARDRVEGSTSRTPRAVLRKVRTIPRNAVLHRRRREFVDSTVKGRHRREDGAEGCRVGMISCALMPLCCTGVLGKSSHRSVNCCSNRSIE